ncbi:MAG: hypothetical protein HQL82_14585 [Magnetococcales bacterium]|nr:hypothetical protein [Magnetococcales bacterium]
MRKRVSAGRPHPDGDRFWSGLLRNLLIALCIGLLFKLVLARLLALSR